jgi:hypothetical protein
MKKTGLLTLVLILAFTIVPLTLQAGELAGVTLDDTLRIGEETVTLAGMGIRTKTFLKIKVYVAGLYMKNRSNDPADIIGSDQAKAIVMSFLYKEVEGEKLQESWRDGFKANTPSAGPELKKRMDEFVSLFSAAAIKGDKYIFAYEPGIGTTISLNGDIKATIPGADFASALMAIWFGDKLGDGGLKTLKKSLLKGMN